jgi:hypothetical protein
MTASLQCPSCGKPLTPIEASRGVGVTCPQCGRDSSIPPPPEPGHKTPLPPPTQRWWVRLPSGRHLGPADRPAVVQWIREDKVGSGCFVACDVGGSWKPIEKEFPEVLAPRAAESGWRDYAPGKNILTGLPAAGLLDPFTDAAFKLDPDTERLHRAAHERLAKECERSTLGVRLLGAKSLQLRTRLPPEPGLGPPRRPVADSVLLAACQWMEQEFYVVIPWGELGQLPHEWFSVVPESFPSALALRRKSENVFDHGIWTDILGLPDSPLAREARHAQVDLTDGINWRWVSAETDFEMILIWGFQIVPLGPRACLHILQTGMLGALRRTFGVDWYLHRQHAFCKFRDHLAVKGDHEPHFLVASLTGQILNRLVAL